ncbi:MAG: hypothetical protein H7A51_09630 [Akkermansiaceae bacterium]|nr:hypothetical protein [Akkermansiaceae bacterium]
MFKAIVTDEGAVVQASVAFFLTFSVFFLIMIRAWRVRRVDDDRVANLPLEDDSETSHTH